MVDERPSSGRSDSNAIDKDYQMCGWLFGWKTVTWAKKNHHASTSNGEGGKRRVRSGANIGLEPAGGWGFWDRGGSAFEPALGSPPPPLALR
jgi:hypothetical protein